MTVHQISCYIKRPLARGNSEASRNENSFDFASPKSQDNWWIRKSLAIHEKVVFQNIRNSLFVVTRKFPTKIVTAIFTIYRFHIHVRSKFNNQNFAPKIIPLQHEMRVAIRWCRLLIGDTYETRKTAHGVLPHSCQGRVVAQAPTVPELRLRGFIRPYATAAHTTNFSKSPKNGNA